jgi:predicted PP-loop superfamily ATPase
MKKTRFNLLEIEDFFTNKGIELRHTKKQIRKRISYKFWKPIVQQVSSNIETHKRNNVIQKIWREMDDRHCFQTLTQSVYDLESLALCTEDYDNGYWREE